MSKKKSYMDKENILSESLLKMLGKLIPFKELIKKVFSTEDKDVFKDPGVMRALNKFNTTYDRAKKSAEEHGKKLDKEIKKYKKKIEKLDKQLEKSDKDAGLKK